MRQVRAQGASLQGGGSRNAGNHFLRLRRYKENRRTGNGKIKAYFKVTRILEEKMRGKAKLKCDSKEIYNRGGRLNNWKWINNRKYYFNRHNYQNWMDKLTAFLQGKSTACSTRLIFQHDQEISSISQMQQMCLPLPAYMPFVIPARKGKISLVTFILYLGFWSAPPHISTRC